MTVQVCPSGTLNTEPALPLTDSGGCKLEANRKKPRPDMVSERPSPKKRKKKVRQYLFSRVPTS